MIRVVLALVGVILALSGLTFSKTAEEGRLRKVIAGHETCAVALATNDLQAANSTCPAATKLIHAAWNRAETCDRALLEADLFTVRASCSTEVMTLLAQRDAEAGRADRLTETLADERADRAAAITRAEGRVRTETERKLRAEAVIQNAPRNGDGLVVLDAQRLCELRSATDACAPVP